MAAAGVLLNSSEVRSPRLIEYPTLHTNLVDRRKFRSVSTRLSLQDSHFRSRDYPQSAGNPNSSPSPAYHGLHTQESRSIYPLLPNSRLNYKSNSIKKYPAQSEKISNSRKLLRHSSHWKSSIPSSALYQSPSQINQNALPLRPHTSAGKIAPYKPKLIDWTSPYASISATGQGLLSESYKNKSFYNPNFTMKKNYTTTTHLPHHTLVNYVPFYDHRTRGDGSSAGESSTSKKVFASAENENPIKDTALSSADKVEKRPPSNLRQSRPESPEWPGASRPKSEKKRVRFSSTISDQMVEPEYVETLLHSVSKRLQGEVKEGWVAPVESREDLNHKAPTRATPSELASTVDEETTNFVLPVTRITVTRRKPNEDETVTSKQTTAATDSIPSKPANSYSGQKVQSMAAKLITNSSPKNAASATPESMKDTRPNEITRPTKTVPRKSVGFLSARAFRKGEIMPISRYVQKKQAIISASFPERPRPERQTFMSYATRLTRNESPRKLSQKSDLKGKNSEDLSNKDGKVLDTPYRRTGVSATSDLPKHRVQCVSLDLSVNNMAPTVTVLSIESPRASNTLLPNNATHFQPIPSMPEHINFCDPGKTEHILEWLNDVNRKRNVESKNKRVSSSMSSKTIS